MKKFKDLLIEASTPKKLEPGTKFTSPDGYEIKITNIWIQMTLRNPEAYIEYEYKNDDKKGKESNSLAAFNKLIIKGKN